ncbi:hypothetical protein VTK56DRAFT_9936 [Thermocarpiscus australiensis]
MVTRKSLPQNAVLDPAVPGQAQNLRSPANTEDEIMWGDEAIQQRQQQQGNTRPAAADVPAFLRPGATASFPGFGDESNVWAEGAPAAETEAKSEVPIVLRPGSSQGKDIDTAEKSQAGQDAMPVPAVLRPGGGVHKPETNPFKRKMSLSASGASSQKELGEQAPPPSLPPLPAFPLDDFSQLSIDEASNNPWQPTLDEKEEATATPPVPALPEQDSARDNVWASAEPSQQATPGAEPTPPGLPSLPSEEVYAGWEEVSQKPTVPPPLNSTAEGAGLESSNAWDDLGTIDKGNGPVQAPPLPSKEADGAVDDWNLIDLESHSQAPLNQSIIEDVKDRDASSSRGETTEQPKAEDAPPELPPRNSAAERPPAPPPRPVDKTETYQIKNINWYDATASQNPRTSPILVQNANGPCPLVALVNALTLTTPADKPNTALVETLRSREQVSLGLLLDAVFDELMSERRTTPDVALPDVTELYNFLQGLHTGMNVNPRFIPTPEVVTAFKRTSLAHLHPTERTDMIPGTFEHTKEMALYSTFSIPLIHGWLPSRDDVVYDAFARQAASYEDVQNLLFREEELEEKLSSSHHLGLTEEEQQVYQDILTIKSFLSISATQLTRFGLDVIRKSMKPGSVAILFRNDHFSTLYRHPQTLQLFTLVTDAGYAGHAEVVWESLVDVNGESAEFFSGDFRLVGGASHDQSGPSRDRMPGSWTEGAATDNDGWTTVQARRGRQQANRQPHLSNEPALSPNHEQEDRDLALALQLQEEEEERHRAEQERRRRESLVSEQYIEQQARSGANTTPPRGGRRSAQNLSRGGGRSQSTTSLPSSTSSTSVNPSGGTTTGGAANHNHHRPRPATQTVRSLLPPLTSSPQPSRQIQTQPVLTRRRPTDDVHDGGGLDDAPPSYEQAAKQTPYVPPAGHPSHPASSPSAAAERLSQLSGLGSGSGPGASRGAGRPARFTSSSSSSGVAGYPGDGRPPSGFRRGAPPPPVQARAQAQAAGPGTGPGTGTGSGGRERECCVM